MIARRHSEWASGLPSNPDSGKTALRAGTLRKIAYRNFRRGVMMGGNRDRAEMASVRQESRHISIRGGGEHAGQNDRRQ